MNNSIAQIKEECQKASLQFEKEENAFLLFNEILQKYGKDSRKGVQTALSSLQKSFQKQKEERQRTEALYRYEKHYWQNFSYLCGIDEAGRGPLAGPVVAGAVILPKEKKLLWLNDSKKLSEKKREELYEVIAGEALAWSVGIVTPKRIDEINILQATYEAMQKAIEGLSVFPELLLNDAVTIPNIAVTQIPIIKGDSKSASIAAASIMAKVTRDRIMLEYDQAFPEYGFASHKGYSSTAHIEALKRLGPCSIHRRTFLRNFFEVPYA